MKQVKTNRYALALCLALALLLGGCRNAPVENSHPPVGEVLPPTVTQSPSPFAAQGMRLAICTSPGAIDDQARNAACYDGVLSFLATRSGMDTAVALQETTGDPTVASRFFQDALSSYDVMIFVGSVFSEIAPLVKENPDKFFLLVDASLSGEEETLPDNLCVLEFAEQDCGFLAGVAAAMESRTDRIAVVNDIPSPSSTRYYYGFRSGVAYANGNLGTTAEIIEHPSYSGYAADGTFLGGNYTGGNEVTAYALSDSLIDEGCDILFVAAGASGIGAFNAVKNRPGAKVIGSETDQFLNGSHGEANIILTSVTKNYADAVLGQLQAIVDGTFRSGEVVLRCADNAIGYLISGDHQQLRPETQQALSNAYPMMQDGTIVPMSGPSA